MQLAALIHLTGVALDLIGPDSKLILVGSSSLLASFSGLGEEEALLGTSYDADIVTIPWSEDIGIMLQEALGEDRRFHRLHGYCVDVLRLEVGEQFAKGWLERLVPLPGMERVKCLEPYDLAAVKCRTGREKDLALIAALAKRGLIEFERVADRLREMPMIESQTVAAFRNLKTMREMAASE